jgi:hypothetical protein
MARADEIAEPPKEPLWRRFGRRNLLYVAFVILLIPLGIALEATGPGGPDRGGGVGGAVLAGGLVSLAFFLVNAVLAGVALAKGRPARIALIACALPAGLVLGLCLLAALISF